MGIMISPGTRRLGLVEWYGSPSSEQSHPRNSGVLTSDQILTNAIHELDMLQYWLGDITEVFAMEGLKERPYPVDSTVQLIFKFASGVVGSFLLTE